MTRKRAMVGDAEPAFERFVAQNTKNLQRIAGHTRGAYQLDDVKQEAWVLAYDLGMSGKIDPGLRDANSQQVLLSHLYQKLVRYSEQHLRKAVSLDPLVEYGDDETHALLDTLASDNLDNPLDDIIEREASLSAKWEPDAHHSLASAWVHLVRRFENDMAKVAQHLLISLSHTYRCHARARCFAAYQQPAPITVGTRDFQPGPWRRFRLQRTPVQLSFTFDDELPLSA